MRDHLLINVPLQDLGVGRGSGKKEKYLGHRHIKVRKFLWLSIMINKGHCI